MTLIDLQQEPTNEIIPDGIRIGDKTYEWDDIIFVTEFDAITGALLNIDI